MALQVLEMAAIVMVWWLGGGSLVRACWRPAAMECRTMSDVRSGLRTVDNAVSCRASNRSGGRQRRAQAELKRKVTEGKKTRGLGV